MSVAPPPFFLHVDLDGLWTVAEAYGHDAGAAFERDPIFELALPRLLSSIERAGMRATFFVVARDLEVPSKRAAIAEIARRGHALANHSRSHRIGLGRLDDEALRDEIAGASRAIEAVRDEALGSGASGGAGPRPPAALAGFRAPGYDASPRVLAAALAAGHRYDGSSLPTPFAPLLRFAANRLRASGSPPPDGLQYGDAASSPRELVRAASGAFSLAPDPCRPFAFRGSGEGAGTLLRLPVAVSARLRLPLSMSLSMPLGARAVAGALGRLARAGSPLTWLLHGIDAAAPEEIRAGLPSPLAASRAFATPLVRKARFLAEVLAEVPRFARPTLAEEWIEDPAATRTILPHRKDSA